MCWGARCVEEVKDVLGGLARSAERVGQSFRARTTGLADLEEDSGLYPRGRDAFLR